MSYPLNDEPMFSRNMATRIEKSPGCKIFYRRVCFALLEMLGNVGAAMDMK